MGEGNRKAGKTKAKRRFSWVADGDVCTALFCDDPGPLHSVSSNGSTLVRRLLRSLVRNRSRSLAVGRLARLVCLGCVSRVLREGGTVEDTWEVSRVAIAVCEAGAVVSWVVPRRSHLVVDVRAVLCGVVSRVEACSEGELSRRHERRPFVHLSPLAVLSWSGLGEDESTWRVACTSSTVWVELTTFVTGFDVHLGEVTRARDLEEVWRLDKMGLLDRTVGNQTSTVARPEAVGNLLLLVGADFLLATDGCPQTEVVEGVHEDVLALGAVAGGAKLLARVGADLALLPGVWKLVDREGGLAVVSSG